VGEGETAAASVDDSAGDVSHFSLLTSHVLPVVNSGFTSNVRGFYLAWGGATSRAAGLLNRVGAGQA
jgi:hypothetical protein